MSFDADERDFWQAYDRIRAKDYDEVQQDALYGSPSLVTKFRPYPYPRLERKELMRVFA